MILIFWLAFFILLLPVGYLLLLALASARASASPKIIGLRPSHHFAIAIPAHSEEGVIGNTVTRLFDLNYPKDLFDIHVVADHCTDQTAAAARRAGAVVHERSEGARTGKGAALSWLFKRILSHDDYDAIVIFDADSQVDPDFLRVMDARLAQGDLINNKIRVAVVDATKGLVILEEEGERFELKLGGVSGGHVAAIAPSGIN